jgi:hypothetical protein
MTQTEEAETTVSQDAQPALEQTTPVRPLLQLWYHEADQDLLVPINPFFLHLQRRLPIGTCLLTYKTAPVAPKLFDNTDYFRQRYEENLAEYRQKKQTHEEQHQAALVEPLAGLQRTALLVPCISPAFLAAFDHDLGTVPALAKALENPQFAIMPLLVRPTETGSTFTVRPLSAYAEGNERETALKELIAVMEKILCNTLHMEPRTTAVEYLCSSPQTVQPVIPSEKTTMDLVLEALEPVRSLVEQVNTQIVEARQLAIAERSEHQTIEALESQIETLRQQVQVPSFWSRFRKKQS